VVCRKSIDAAELLASVYLHRRHSAKCCGSRIRSVQFETSQMLCVERKRVWARRSNVYSV
jgi:hypothetical protein